MVTAEINPKEVMEEYLKTAIAEGVVNEKTVRTYRGSLNPFIKVFGQVKDRASLVKFLRERYPNERTQHGSFRAIKTFVRWGAGRGLWEDWISGIKIKFSIAPQSPVLDEAEFEKLIAAIPVEAKFHNYAGAVGLRDRAFFSCVFYSGCRRDAIRLLRIGDVNLEDGWMKIKTKGRKEAYIPIHAKALRRLKIWMARNPSDEWVFPSTRRPEYVVDGSQLTHVISDYAKAAGIKKRVYIHLLRHSCATLMAKSGVQIDVIQSVLMHSSILTTQNYINRLAARDRVESAYKTVFGDGSTPPPAAVIEPVKVRQLTAEELEVRDWM